MHPLRVARQGRSVNGIARELGVGYGTAWTCARAMQRGDHGESGGHGDADPA